MKTWACFFLPETDATMTLLAVGLLQGWISERKSVSGCSDWAARVVVKDAVVREFIAPALEKAGFEVAKDMAGVESVGIHFCFDPSSARALARETQCPAAVAFAAQLGTAAVLWPDLAGYIPAEPESEDWAFTDDMQRVFAAAEAHDGLSTAAMVWVAPGEDGEHWVDEVQRVLGLSRVGLVTGKPYLAMAGIATGRKVVELYPASEPRSWLRKPSLNWAWVLEEGDVLEPLLSAFGLAKEAQDGNDSH